MNIEIFKNKYFQYISLFLILLLPFLLGSRMILAGDFNYLYDQARDLMLTKSVAVDHKLMLIGSRSGIGGFFHGPLYIYLLVPFFFLGNGNPLAFTPLFVAIGIVTVTAGFIVGKKLYNIWVGFLVAFFLALSPRIWGYFASNQGINLIPLLYLLMFYNLINYLRGKRKSFIWAAFFTGLTFQFETATALVLVPIITFLYFLLPKAINEWKIIVASIASFAISISSFILFDIRHEFLMTRSLANYVLTGNGKGYLPLPLRLNRHFMSLIDVYKSALIKENLLLQLLLLTIVLMVLWLFFQKKAKSIFKGELLLFGLFPIATYAFFMLHSQYVYPEYALGLIVPIVFFISLCIYLIKDLRIGQIAIIALLSVSLIQSMILIFNQYSKPYKNLGAGSYKNQKEMVDWIFRDASGKKFGYFVFTNETFTSNIDYLMWWAGTRIYNNMPTNAKQPITYLIMYTPTVKEDKGVFPYWKKHTIRTNGHIITEKFLYDITIQKLEIPPNDPPPDPNYYQNLIFR